MGITLLIVLSLILIIYSYMQHNSEKKVSDKIIEYIEDNINDKSLCNFSINEITDFKWDNMLLYQVGSSSKEISNLLGVKFRDSVDLASGIIFTNKNKVVYHEQLFYNPERPYKLFLNVGTMYGQLDYFIASPENASFHGSKYLYNDKFYYEVTPFE